MPTNPYFNFYNADNEQSLFENMIIESIQIYGFETFYLPLQEDNFDPIFRESTARTYATFTEMEMYLKSNLNFGGDGKFMSKEVGLEIRDQTIFTVSQKRFKALTGMDRPREGDCVWLPLDKKVYEIKFVDHQDIFYQLGRLLTFDLQCELLEYNGERFITGIPDIDIISQRFEMEEDNPDPGEEWLDQSPEIQSEANNDITWDQSDPFSMGGTT